MSTAAPILVTGAGGCIGAWLLRQLGRSGIPAVAFDLVDNRNRLRLVCGDEDKTLPDSLTWETGDIADSARVQEVVAKHQPAAIIHLAALQVPFCAADPVAGAQINVVGGVNVFEAAKTHGIKKIVYASSVAATGMEHPAQWKQTLYGAYKICNEQTARVYWHDAGVASIGIRPSVVYGIARDQGMSAAPTQAVLAALRRQAFNIPFTGAVGFVHAAEAAAAFIQAATNPDAAKEGAPVFALNGIPKDIEEVITLIKARLPNAEITASGAPLPFPADDSDEPLHAAIGAYWQPTFEEGLDSTIALFKQRIAQGYLTA